MNQHPRSPFDLRPRLRVLPLAALLVLGCFDDYRVDAPSTAPGGGGGTEAVRQELHGAFVPIHRRSRGARDARLHGDEEGDFYLALAKSELGKRWFLTTYVVDSDLPDFHSQAAGTVVVTFQVQNGRLIVAHAADTMDVTDVITPEALVEAYPLVDGVEDFERRRNADDYVLFDPALGLNRITIFGLDSHVLQSAVVFSRAFRKLDAGFGFEQVVTGNVGDFRVSLTLAQSLRPYGEGEGFVPLPLPMVDWYFPGSSHIVKNEGRLQDHAARWNVRPEGPPIVWTISSQLQKYQADPRFADLDLMGAIAAGIETWNEAFGFRALEARLAAKGEQAGHDEVNYLVLDDNVAAGFAFADIRANPITAEIRGASVYIPLAAVVANLPPFETNAGSPTQGQVQASFADTRPASGVQISWSGIRGRRLCDFPISVGSPLPSSHRPASAFPTTRKAQVESYLAHLVAHEIGHTLGLRHNFKGSLMGLSGSVMDYHDAYPSVAMGARLGDYDKEAIRHLYGLTPVPANRPFCTDEHLSRDPDCAQWDFGARPLTDTWIPFYSFLSELVLQGRLPPLPAVVDALVPHLRNAAIPDDRRLAYDAAMGPVRGPLRPGTHAIHRDILTSALLASAFVHDLPRAYPDPETGRPPLARPPVEPVLSAAVADLVAFATDPEGQRAIEVRRNAIDLLKRFQHVSAYAALTEIRTTLAARLPTLTGAAAIHEMDLIARIDGLLSPYFD